MSGVYAYADNTITVTEGTESVPANMADMQTANDGGGWGVMNNPIAGVYIIDANVDFGDGSTATYFMSKDSEMVRFTSGYNFIVKTNATLSLGVLDGSWGVRGADWAFSPTDPDMYVVLGGTLLIYASTFRNYGVDHVVFTSGTLIVKNSILSSTWDYAGSSWRQRFAYLVGLTTLEMNDVFTHNIFDFNLRVSPDELRDIHIHKCSLGFDGSGGSLITTNGLRITEVTSEEVLMLDSGTDINVVNPNFTISTVKIYNEDGWIKEQYTVNIHVSKSDGTNLSGANVKCYDKNNTEVFSVNTDASGDIAEQTVTYKKWEGTAETLTEYTPHKFVVSKTGYEPLTIESYTVDSLVVENWELQNPVPSIVRLENVEV